MVTTDTTTARGPLMPNLKPNPKPKLIPPLMLGMDTMAVTDTDMAEDTMVDTTDTLTDTDTDTMAVTDTDMAEDTMVDTTDTLMD